MKYKTSKPIQWLARAASVVMWNQFRYPQPVKDVYDVADNTFEKLKWAYRCWVHQLERAEKDSGIEDYFSGQKMEFTLPEDFQVQEEVTMSAGGDLMAVDCLTYENTPHLFDEIADFYFGADITCANLESTVFHKAPLGRNQVMGMPAKMNTSEAMLDRFWQEGAGINYFSTANNHCFDHGEDGLFATLDCLEKRGCYHSGTNRNREEQEDVLVIEKNGIRIAMLSYTFDMNGNHYENKALINEVRFNDRNPDLSLVKRHVKRAGEKKADIIVASVHWGWEFELYPHKNVIETGHKLAEMGIDVIIGGHPHVCQQMENYKGSLILYSMGDFVSYHPLTKDSRLTYVVKFRIAKGIEKGSAAGTCRIHDFQILPVYILTEERADESYDCRLVPFENVLRDTDIDGAFRYGLTQKERKDLPRLWNKVLMKILLPSNGKDLLVKTQKREGRRPEKRGYLMKYEMLDRLLEEKRAVFENVSDRIWEFAETRFQEKQSAALQKETLRAEGFEIQENLGGIETAFSAKFGAGHPVIGILGEYDALPGMSQKADLTKKEPEAEGAPGHGCGHHLLGTGCMEAAVAVKDYLMKNPMEGTVVYYGCPGEEGGAGKAFMVREGCFEDCDICLAWHPYSANFSSISTLANARIFYDFHGVSAHAAAAPHLGRSALDAVELMSVGVNYLREHMIPEARVHYAVTNAGGEAPNVVPAYAQVLYSVRAPGTEELHKLIGRVNKVAEGAAMMTETEVEIRVVSAYSDVLQNKTLDQLVFSHIREIYPLKYTEEEMAYAEKFHAAGDPGDWKTYQGLARQFYGEKGSAFFKGAMADTIFPPVPVKMGSTDVGDVSWTVPTSWFGSACYALGTPAHSWLAVAQGKSGIAKRGMEAAASVIARTALDILENPGIAAKAKEDMEKAKNGFTYKSVIPAEVKAGAF